MYAAGPVSVVDDDIGDHVEEDEDEEGVTAAAEDMETALTTELAEEEEGVETAGVEVT